MNDNLKQCSVCDAFYTDTDLTTCLIDDAPLRLLKNYFRRPYHCNYLPNTEQRLKGGESVVMQELQNTIDSCKWEIKYPQLRGNSSQNHHGKINAFLEREFTKEICAERYKVEVSEDHIFDRSLETDLIDLNYQISLFSDGLLSIEKDFRQHFKEESYVGWQRSGYVFDLVSGKELNYIDLFKPESDYRIRTLQIVMAQYPSLQNCNWRYPEICKFILFPECIRIYDFVVGYDVDIEYQDVIDLIDPDDQLGKYLYPQLSVTVRG